MWQNCSGSLIRGRWLHRLVRPAPYLHRAVLINDERLTRELRNTRIYNALGWATFSVITLAIMVMLATQLLEIIGVELL